MELPINCNQLKLVAIMKTENKATAPDSDLAIQLQNTCAKSSNEHYIDYVEAYY